MRWLQIFAWAGAVAHVFFAYQETIGWGRKFVAKAAPSWTKGADVDAHIAWARELAFNVGAYNLMLAVGLAWTALTDAGMARPLAFFFAAWLIAAAAAAAYTRVYLAAAIQGVLGLALLVAA
jgi:uncharacterized membrane protein